MKKKSSVFLNDFGSIIDFEENEQKTKERFDKRHSILFDAFFEHLIWVKGQLDSGELILTTEPFIVHRTQTQ